MYKDIELTIKVFSNIIQNLSTASIFLRLTLQQIDHIYQIIIIKNKLQLDYKHIIDLIF